MCTRVFAISIICIYIRLRKTRRIYISGVYILFKYINACARDAILNNI